MAQEPTTRPPEHTPNWVWSSEYNGWNITNEAGETTGFVSGTQYQDTPDYTTTYANPPGTTPTTPDYTDYWRSREPGTRAATFQTMVTADPRFQFMGPDARQLFQRRLDPLQGRYFLDAFPTAYGGQGEQQQSFRDYIRGGEFSPTTRAGSPWAAPNPWTTQDWTSRVGDLTTRGFLPGATTGYAGMTPDERLGARRGFLEAESYGQAPTGGGPSLRDLMDDMQMTEALAIARGRMGLTGRPGAANRWQDAAFNRSLAGLEFETPGILQNPQQMLVDLAMRGWNPGSVYGTQPTPIDLSSINEGFGFT
jgi:hypothetical protein